LAEHYRFFDPVLLEDGTYDREYNAREFVEYFAALVTTGVMKGAGSELSVSADGASMVTRLGTGIVFINGHYYENDNILAHTHDTETVGKDRIDRVVLRLDLSTEARYVKSYIKKGVANTSPVAPSLQRDNLVYEISVALVRIVGGQTYILSNNVTDERGEEDICPWVGSKILPNFDDNALDELMNSIGEANGLAQLDSNGQVPVSQLGNAPNPPDASTSRKGIVQLNNSISSTSTSTAATSSAVKSAYDIGNSTKFKVDTWLGDNYNSATRIAFQSDGAERTYLSATAYNSSNTAMNYKTGLGAGFSIDGSYCTALGAGTRASALYTTAVGSFARAINAGEGVLGTTYNDGGSYTWKVPGSFSVSGTKNFEIPHPHPNKKDTHIIRHGAVESPTAGDTLYRYEIEAKTDGETVEIQLPDYFEHLNINIDVWVNPHLHFGRAYGVVQGDMLKVTCETAGMYKALVIGTRNDDNVQDWYIKGVEREVGESWTGETYVFEVDEITEMNEFEEVFQ
jgi:hypothetical protein